MVYGFKDKKPVKVAEPAGDGAAKQKNDKPTKRARVLGVTNMTQLFQAGDAIAYKDVSYHAGHLYRLAYKTASRLSEIRELELPGCIREAANKLVIYQSKNDAPKQIVIDNDIREILSELPNAGPLFPGAYDGHCISRASADRHLKELITEFCDRDIKDFADAKRFVGVTTHSFRRTRATLLYKGLPDKNIPGMRPEMIIQITGHKSVARLLSYIDIAPEEAAETAAMIDSELFPDGLL